MEVIPKDDSGTVHHRSDSDRRGLLLPVVALIVALAALGLAAWPLIRDWTGDDSKYTVAEGLDARQKVCAAAELVRNGVSLNTNLAPPGGPEDVTGSLAIAANARVALYDGGQYLLARLDPATPTELADEVRKFANSLMDIGAAATTGIPNDDPQQAARLRDADAANTKIQELCK